MVLVIFRKVSVFFDGLVAETFAKSRKILSSANCIRFRATNCLAWLVSVHIQVTGIKCRCQLESVQVFSILLRQNFDREHRKISELFFLGSEVFSKWNDSASVEQYDTVDEVRRRVSGSRRVTGGMQKFFARVRKMLSIESF